MTPVCLHFDISFALFLERKPELGKIETGRENNNLWKRELGFFLVLMDG